MKVITLQTILTKMEDDAKGNRGCGIIMLAFLAGILILGGAAILSPLTLVPIGLFGIPGIMFLRSSKKKKESLANKSIYIITDICQQKHTESCGEDGDAYILTFQSGLKHTISSEDTHLSGAEDDESLYRSTEPGDSFYLIYRDNCDKPDYILPQKSCQLDMTGFVEESGRIVPRKVTL